MRKEYGLLLALVCLAVLLFGCASGITGKQQLADKLKLSGVSTDKGDIKGEIAAVKIDKSETLTDNRATESGRDSIQNDPKLLIAIMGLFVAFFAIYSRNSTKRQQTLIEQGDKRFKLLMEMNNNLIDSFENIINRSQHTKW